MAVPGGKYVDGKDLGEIWKHPHSSKTRGAFYNRRLPQTSSSLSQGREGNELHTYRLDTNSGDGGGWVLPLLYSSLLRRDAKTFNSKKERKDHQVKAL